MRALSEEAYGELRVQRKRQVFSSAPRWRAICVFTCKVFTVFQFVRRSATCVAKFIIIHMFLRNAWISFTATIGSLATYVEEVREGRRNRYIERHCKLQLGKCYKPCMRPSCRTSWKSTCDMWSATNYSRAKSV